MGQSALPAYIYRFKHVLSFDCWGPDYQFCKGVVCHGSELPFVFNVFTDGTITYYPTADEKQLSQDLVNAWANFIKNSNPNSNLAVPAYFPQYSASADGLVVLDEPGSEDQAHVRDSYCNMWDQIGFFW
jgi:carboxylesterase type B